MIRRQLEIILGEEFRFLAIKTRERLGLTQREMSESLQMSEGNYSDIETGEVGCCSTLTAIYYHSVQLGKNRLVEDHK